MRIWLSFLLLSIFSLAYSQELVRHGDFDYDASLLGLSPAGWEVEPAGASGWKYDNADGIMSEGKAASSARFTLENNAGALKQNVSCKPNTEYVLSAALKVNGCTPKVEVLTPEGKLLATVQGDNEQVGVWYQTQQSFNSGTAKQLVVRLTGSVAEAKVGAQAKVDQVSIVPAATVASQKAAQPAPFVAPGENIALHKPYTMRPGPSYGHCSDPDDKIQLTDGIYSKGYFWVQKSTVGWVKGAIPVVITIDLGREEPISGISWNTAAGTAGVAWPRSLQVYVSSDQENWFYQGDLVKLGTKHRRPPQDRYGIFKYATDELQTKGRWVQVLVIPEKFVFCDEIEVFRGKDDWLAQEAGENAISSSFDYFWGKIKADSVKKRLHDDLLEINDSFAKMRGWTAGLTPAKARVADLEKEINDLPEIELTDFQTILPLNATHAAIYALNAVRLRAAGYRQPAFWHNNRWDNLSLIAVPPTGPAAVSLRTDMMRNEVRGETINLCNPTDTDIEYVLKLKGLPVAAAAELRTVINTDTKQNEAIGAALQATDAADGSLSLLVPAGCTKQIWLSFRRPTLADGHYRGYLHAEATGLPSLRAEVNLRILGQFPAQPSLHVGGWDYVDGLANTYRARGNLVDNMAMMRDMYVDSPWGRNLVTPKNAAFDADGNLTNADKLDFTNWDQWVKRWEGARQYCVYMSFKGGPFFGEPMGTPRFQRMVADYMTAWAAYLRKTNLKPSQLVLLLVDEPRSADKDRIIITWAKAIKAANTGIRIFEDPIYLNPREGLPEMFSLSDILCPNTPMMLKQGEDFTAFYLEQQAAGRELWLYSCSGPAKLLDPISYHRAQKWRAFEIGAKGSFYWAFGCAGGLGDSWRAYRQSGIEYSPYFISQTSVLEGKHSEAIREGVQDYEYLLMLKNKIVEMKKMGWAEDKIAAAEKLLAEAPTKALANVLPESLNWREPKDRSLMDQVRVEVLEMLHNLK